MTLLHIITGEMTDAERCAVEDVALAVFIGLVCGGWLYTVTHL